MLRSRKPMRRTKLAPISPKRKSRTGKEGITRLRGEDMAASRREVYFRSNGYCQMRQRLVAQVNEKIESGEMTAQQGAVAIAQIQKSCWKWVSEPHGHDAHIETKRNHGDLLDNRVWSCPPCHEASHNAFNKPVPPKPKVSSCQ